MSVDVENVKKAVDAFEADDFVTSKELLKKEIINARQEYIKDKVGLKDDK